MNNPIPPPTTQPSEYPSYEKLSGAPEMDEQAKAWNIFLKILAYIPYLGDWIAENWIHSLSQENGTGILARRPPSWMTEAQKVRANAFVKNHFIQMLQKVPNDEKLCYTWYSIALDKKEKSKKCHTVLVQKVETWLKEKTEVRLGIDQDSGRKMLSPDFLDACCPKLINRDPVITTLYIHGPVAITDCLKLRDTIRSMEQLANLHFKLNKKSAEYFIKELSHILENRTITIITLHNFSETNDMVIEPSVYDTLDNQNQCGITFTNIPKPNKQFNQLTFN